MKFKVLKAKGRDAGRRKAYTSPVEVLFRCAVQSITDQSFGYFHKMVQIGSKSQFEFGAKFELGPFVEFEVLTISALYL